MLPIKIHPVIFPWILLLPKNIKKHHLTKWFPQFPYFELILSFISAAVQGRSKPMNLSSEEGEGEVEGDVDILLLELRGVAD